MNSLIIHDTWYSISIRNDDVTTLPSDVVRVFPVMPLFVCLSAVQHDYIGQEVHNLIRNQNKYVTTAIVATVTISTTNLFKLLLLFKSRNKKLNTNIIFDNRYIIFIYLGMGDSTQNNWYNWITIPLPSGFLFWALYLKNIKLCWCLRH